MNGMEVQIYESDLGLNGTIPVLVDLANRYTADYTDAALNRISELAMLYGLDRKYIEIPLLLRDERFYEESEKIRAAHCRLKIDHYLGNRISLSISNFLTDGCELEIFEENDKVIISLNGIDENGAWSAAEAYSVNEFMTGTDFWLDNAIGQIMFYTKQYEEEVC